MVTINTTFFIELILFLIFLWGTKRFFLSTVLQSLDERQETIDRNLADTEADTLKAETLENDYRHEIAVIRKHADDEVRAAQQKSQQEHVQFLQEERTRAEERILEIRAEAQKQIDAQQNSIDAQVPDLVSRIITKLSAGKGF